MTQTPTQKTGQTNHQTAIFTDEQGQIYCFGADGFKYLYDSQTQKWFVDPNQVFPTQSTTPPSPGAAAQPADNYPKVDKNGQPPGFKRTRRYKRRRGYYFFRSLIDLILTVAALPIVIASVILESFYRKDGPGKRALAGFIFILFSLIGADNIYQLFGGSAILPIFETSFQGWNAAAICLVDPVFIIAALLSVFLQVNQGKAFRGLSINEAKANYEKSYHALPNRPTGCIDLSIAAWNDYKRAGMQARSSTNWMIGLSWAFELFSAFYANWFMAQPSLFLRFAAFIYSGVSVFAAEFGYSVWEESTTK